MTTAKPATAIPRLALRVGEAAQALGVSDETFNRHIRPELKVVRRGDMKLFAVTELQAWLDRSASRALDEVEP